MSGPGFAVIDVVTTGLLPGSHDSVTELAVVHVSADGRIEGEWDTLLRAASDVSSPRIRPIRPGIVIPAPTFEEILPQLTELLDGRVLVSHNASFTLRFIVAEFERCGVRVVPGVVSLCTMQLARDLKPQARRSLPDTCADFGITLPRRRSSLVDARAAAELLGAFMGAADDRSFWYQHVSDALEYRWPTLSASATRAPWHPRSGARDRSASMAQSFLGRITAALPDVEGPSEHLDYLALLDRCLRDRYFAAQDAHALVDLSDELGISRYAAETLHLDYFADITRVAREQGTLTIGKLSDLVEVGNLLDLPTSVIRAALEQPIEASAAARTRSYPASRTSRAPLDYGLPNASEAAIGRLIAS
jgi:DNA polymerase-3 subunit epsilon